VAPATPLPGWFVGFSCTGHRLVLALLVVLVILAILLVTGTIWEFELERLLTETRAVQTPFHTLVGGITLFVSCVGEPTAGGPSVPDKSHLRMQAHRPLATGDNLMR